MAPRHEPLVSGRELFVYCLLVVAMSAAVYLALFGSGNVVMP